MDLRDQLQRALGAAYRLERQLGQGGMAIVCLAEDEKHQRRVAVKRLRPELAAALGADRFTREIRIAARLQHPYILAQGVVHRDIKPDYVLISGRHALVTDFGVTEAVSEARARGSSCGHESLTSAGVPLGTPAYLTPEQTTGEPWT